MAFTRLSAWLGNCAEKAKFEVADARRNASWIVTDEPQGHVFGPTWYQRLRGTRFQRVRGPQWCAWGGGCVECSPARHSVFLTAELVETGILPSLGPKIRIGLRAVCQTGREGSPPAFRTGSAVLAATRIPKTILEELAFGGSCHRALGRARSEGWKTARMPTTSPSERVKGEPGSRNAPARASSTVGPRRFGPMLGGAEVQHDGCWAIRWFPPGGWGTGLLCIRCARGAMFLRVPCQRFCRGPLAPSMRGRFGPWPGYDEQDSRCMPRGRRITRQKASPW